MSSEGRHHHVPARKAGRLRGHPEFVVKPDCIDAFLALAQDDASHSLADEPGCRQFDVVQMEGAPHHVLFYEVYDSRAAFDAHLQTPHLARFREGFPRWCRRSAPSASQAVIMDDRPA